MTKKFTLLIAFLVILLGNNGSIWGQQGVLLPDYQQDIVPRRGDGNGTPGYIGNAGNVNNEFGAGESATVSAGNVTAPTPSHSIIATPATTLQLGSEYSKNIVIRSYNSAGYTAGWLNASVNMLQCANPPSTTGFTAGWYSGGIVTLTGVSGSFNTSPVNLLLTGASAQERNANQVEVQVYALHGSISPKLVFGHEYGVSPYTSTMQLGTPYVPPVTTSSITIYEDDGVKLFQYAGSSAIEPNHFSTPAHVGKAPSTSTGDNNVMTPYKRPTTVAVDGMNTFDNILLKDIDWWYARYKANAGSPGGTQTANHTGCCHMNGITGTAYDANFSFIDALTGTDTRVDAAVQLINGARVCVKGGTKDLTGNIGTPASGDASYAKTNALIVWPIADRITIRTKGDFQVNMTHEQTLSTTSNIKYTAAQFRDPDTDMYLYPNTPHTDVQNIGGTMKNFAHANYTTVTSTAPSTGTYASVFGVYGDYLHTGLMADIHTDLTPFNTSNPGVIEVGTLTKGKKHFHIYGNGMLKNYEGCNITSNFPMHFGKSYGGTPQLQINTDQRLSIVNFGNNGANTCDAELRFHTTSVDSINNAFLSSSVGAGALQIQALSHLHLNADGTWTPAANKGNNIYLLSDGGNISTQKLTIENDNRGGVGRGLVTVWAETDTKTDGCAANSGANRFSKSGNIYFNDAVTLVRAAAQTTQTNIIAANNIRTASLTSTNANDKDTTNIVSRMGDIYLGYSAGSQVRNAADALVSNNLTGNGNRFSYNGTGLSGTLNILAGYDDLNNNTQYGGGNIYFTHMDANMTAGKNHNTNITIPFSNEYICGTGALLHERSGTSMIRYEHAGIIGGVGRCGMDSDFTNYAGLLENPGTAANLNGVTDTSLIYRANNGNLLVDAGTRGNIIMNRGTYLNFQQNSGNAFFLTRDGDIDLRNKTNVDALMGGVLFLANSELPNKLKTSLCGCEEERNNVYLQDLEYRPQLGEGSIFVGADNNIKLQYGGLKNIGTSKDPFLSENKGYTGAGCGNQWHCNSDTSENKARDLILNFDKAAVSGNGGFAAVASDLIDVYKNMIYNGGASGKGMSTVPTYGSLHGEGVAGYGLFIKTQANKENWNQTDFQVTGKCGKTCIDDNCSNSFLHKTARVTFHADARIYTENQKSLISSPVLETFGNLELNTFYKKGSKTSIQIHTDSLICHDSLIIDGPKTLFSTWSNLQRDMPVIKLGHQRFTPPFTEDGNVCAPCKVHTKGVADGLDTVFVTFRNDAKINRLHTLVADHAVISFLTDSFDSVKGNPTLNAKFYTDTFKVRNQVELFNTKDHRLDGHFELISEEQMQSKDYAGIYARHLHLEPIAPTCKPGYSELWLQDPALDVITTSTFGGFGTIHADVHIEIDAKLAPGYASLGKEGNCYEQKAGTLYMQNLRLDKGAKLHYSIGELAGFNGELADCIDVDTLSIYGTVPIYVDKRACQNYEPGCYEIIRYKSVGVENLNNLWLGTTKIDGTPLSLDFSTPGVVYLCVGQAGPIFVQREVRLPQPPAGVTMKPAAGPHFALWGGSFTFSLKFNGSPLKVTTSRYFNDVQEELIGVLNANGEYEYTISQVKSQPILIYIGPDEAASLSMDGTLVWSNNNMLYIRVENEDIASIYSAAGQLVKQIELPQGETSLQMQRGVYVVSMKNGVTHKVVIK